MRQLKKSLAQKGPLAAWVQHVRKYRTHCGKLPVDPASLLNFSVMGDYCHVCDEENWTSWCCSCADCLHFFDRALQTAGSLARFGGAGWTGRARWALAHLREMASAALM
jgi:hypothetical protein